MKTDDIRRDSQTGKWFGTVGYEADAEPALKPCPFCGSEHLRVLSVSDNAHYSVRGPKVG